MQLSYRLGRKKQMKKSITFALEILNELCTVQRNAVVVVVLR